MFTQSSAEQLAKKIVLDWNSNDLDVFMDYFTDDVILVSSNLLRFISESNGKISGKETLKQYWEYTRTYFPYFQYKLYKVNFGENVLMLQFHNADDDSYSYGTLSFNEHMKITRMMVSYV